MVEPTTAAILGSAAINAAGSIFGANKSAKASKKIAAMQLAWEQQKAHNSIQWSVEDAIKAGINPAVAVNTDSNAGGINPPMPDTSGYTSAGQALAKGIELTQRQKEVDAEATKDYANALNAEVEAGLKPKETAIKEMDAETERRRQQQDAQESFARIQRIMTLLPGETEQQKQQIVQNAIDIALRQEQLPGQKAEAQAENKIRDMTGGLLGLNDMKAIITGIAGGSMYHLEKKLDRTSAGKIADDRNKTYMDREKLRQSQRRDTHKRIYQENGYTDYYLP